MSMRNAPMIADNHTSAPTPASRGMYWMGCVAVAPATGAPQLSQKRASARSGAPHAQYPAAAAEVEATSSGAGGGEAPESLSAGGVSVFDSRGSFEMSIGCSRPPPRVSRDSARLTG